MKNAEKQAKKRQKFYSKMSKSGVRSEIFILTRTVECGFEVGEKSDLFFFIT
jgi:hypothetical protein